MSTSYYKHPIRIQKPKEERTRQKARPPMVMNFEFEVTASFTRLPDVPKGMIIARVLCRSPDRDTSRVGRFVSELLSQGSARSCYGHQGMMVALLTELARSEPSMAFHTEFSPSDSGPPRRDWFADGQHTATQCMEQVWGERRKVD